MRDVEELFVAERELRVAARSYAASATDENRKNLRVAAREFAMAADKFEFEGDNGDAK